VGAFTASSAARTRSSSTSDWARSWGGGPRGPAEQASSPAVGGDPGAVHVGGRLTEGLAGLAQLGLEGLALRVVEAAGQAQLGGIDREQGAQLGGVTQGAERRRCDLGAVVEVAGLAVADHDAPPGRVAVDQRAARDLPRRGRSQGVDEPSAVFRRQTGEHRQPRMEPQPELPTSKRQREFLVTHLDCPRGHIGRSDRLL
jgi:hypothetical protein